MAKSKQGVIKRHHGFTVLIMILGWVVPPLAVLVRFGFGLDFFINIILTICGYIPGHGHNFYLQNIRNNKNAKHSPRWAVRAGLVKDYKKKPSNGWEDRYGEGASAYDRQQIEVDPITGETIMDPDSGRKIAEIRREREQRSRGKKKSKILSPWGDNPEGEDWAERNESGNAQDERRGDRESTFDSQDGGMERDPITGAIIGERTSNNQSQGDNQIKRTISRNSTRSTASRYNYADRYGLNGRGQTSESSSFTRSDNMSSNSSIKNKYKKEKKNKKKDRFDRENENGYGGSGDYNDGSGNTWEEEERRYEQRKGGGNGANDQQKKNQNSDPLNDGFQF